MKKIITILLICFSIPAYACNIVVTYKDGVCNADVLGEKFRCSVGSRGISAHKKEGDETTPIGTFPLREVFYRADKIPAKTFPHVALPVHGIKKTDGWCDDPTSKFYNKLVDLQHLDKRIKHEDLYTKDDLYNIIIIVGYNDAPAVPYEGSAIFVRVVGPNYAPTAGSVAFTLEDLLKILPKLERTSHLIVKG